VGALDGRRARALREPVDVAPHRLADRRHHDVGLIGVLELEIVDQQREVCRLSPAPRMNLRGELPDEPREPGAHIRGVLEPRRREAVERMPSAVRIFPRGDGLERVRGKEAPQALREAQELGLPGRDETDAHQPAWTRLGAPNSMRS
jgi:hypothetical protein